MTTELKKTEKLVTAIYLVTSFFDEKEPMRWRLRELGAHLLSSKEKRQVVPEIIGLLTVGKNAGLISDMNYEIIHREFSRLVPEDSSLESLLERNIPEPAPKVVENPVEKPSFYLSSTVERQVPGPVIKDIPTDEVHDKKGLKEFGVVAVKKNGRQSVIINILKRKKEIMIKDVSPLISGCSEKTIQRELSAMVATGILRKIGDKRWSRYALAQNA